MNVAFTSLGLTFETDVVFGDDEDVEFTNLLCEGQDASFLMDSDSLADSINNAAYRAVAAQLYSERIHGLQAHPRSHA